MTPRKDREGRVRKASEILQQIADQHFMEMSVLRSVPKGRPPSRVTAVRKEFILRVRGYIGFVDIADLLFCNVSTVQFHTSEKHRNKVRANCDRYQARLRAKAREDSGIDRAILWG